MLDKIISGFMLDHGMGLKWKSLASFFNYKLSQSFEAVYPTNKSNGYKSTRDKKRFYSWDGEILV